MAISKKQESKNPNVDESESLKSEVASFASSIGLSSSLPNSGFNDSDFRKTGTLLKPSKPFINKTSTTTTPKSLKPLNLSNEVKKKFQENPKSERMNDDSNESKVFNRYKDLPKLPLMKADRLDDVWYVESANLEEKVIGKDGKKKIEPMNEQERKRLVEENKQLGERLLVQYAQDFDNSRGNSGGMKLHRAMQRSGTAIDKVLAYMDIVVQNPIANIKSLDALLAMVTSKVGKRHALTVFEPLKELFLDRLLPKDRKLKSLIQQPVNHLPKSRDGYSLLLFWYWEECLKQKYERFIFALEEASRDILPILKDKAIKTMCALFEGNQEQERRLLSALVNKLGDPENKCAANASYNLLKIFKVHPYMKAVVIDEVDHFLFRPHLGLRAKYHAVNFLSNIKLSSVGDGPMVAMQLLKVYFALFKVLTEAEESKTLENNKEDRKVKRSLENSKEEGPVESNVETDSRILSTLLTGVNRAFNFVASDKVDDFVEVQTPILFKLVHSKNINVGLGALLFLEKVSSRNQVVSDRFYRALYSKFLLPAAMNSSKVGMFLDLLLRAMTSDVNLKRVSAFLKRLMQVALQQPPRFACASLFLLSEVLKARPPLWNMMLQNESSDEDLEHFKDIIEGPLAELEAEPSKLSKNTDWNACNSYNVTKADSDSSDLEIQDDHRTSGSDGFDGADDFLTGESVDDVEKFKTTSTSGKEQPRPYHVWSSLPGGYDPRHREPSYCHAERASWWELMVLASHVHPSVSTMARTFLAGANVVYNGDPLKDFSLIAFLDKLIEKKPKQTTWHGGSEIEPSKKLDTSNHLIGPEILSLAEVDVPPEDLVFHKFYMNKMNSSKKPKKKKKKTKMQDEAAEDIFGVDANNESDEEIGGDESDNEEIDDIIDSGDIPVEADGNYDYDDYDQVADEGDEDLIGSDSDAETDAPSDMEGGEDDGFDLIDVGEADGNFGLRSERQGKQKSQAKTGVSPFAPLEEYDHLLKNDVDGGVSTRNKSKSRKKRRMSE
ncbi:CCAAT/enhancer-binding protein zeta [Thalictrum thalictroides]|uniref:CCAAT/enhancer-binding protein zeta n=1 Tax=Thalictrum thalictroides TaxID=46969 RepID=A0A7J6WAS9_THATH|nr:CCAAT/enhancer-binding protein zeta [Thalictrum thalictroides]